MNIDSNPVRLEAGRNASRGGMFSRLVASTFLAVAALTGSGWWGAQPAAAFDPTVSNDPGVSMSYVQAKEHEKDVVNFEPGDAVTVPYVPRRGDMTLVDGAAPVPLRAGSASGRSMAATRTGTVRAVDDALGAPTPLSSLTVPSASSKPTATATTAATPSATATTANEPAATEVAATAAPNSPSATPDAGPAGTNEPTQAPAQAPTETATETTPGTPAPASPAATPTESPTQTPVQSPSETATQGPTAHPVTESASAATVLAANSTNVLRRQVYGFLPYWESVAGPTLNYDLLSTVAYFGVGVDGKGNLQKSGSGWSGWTSGWMTQVINEAHAKGTRVALTIEEFAWNDSERSEQINLLNDPSYRANAVKQIAAAVVQRGADGVNLDFEPIASTQQANYRSFVRELRAEMDRLQPGMELTFCGTGATGYYDVAGLTAPGAADAVFIMGYDFRTGSSAYAGSIDPLTSPRSVYDLTQVINLWKARTSVSKIILGLPLYGIAWSTTSSNPNATVNKSSCLSPTSVFFAQAALLAKTNGRRYDSIEQSAWTTYSMTCSNGTSVTRELYYDDDQSLGVKYDMINYWNLRGMGIWALGYDAGHPEIPAVMASKFLTDRTPPQVGIVPMAATQNSEGFAVSWTGHDDWNGIASYDVQVSTDGGPFTDWLIGTTETSDDFQGISGHNYSFRVRATDGVGNVGAWNVTALYSATPDFSVGSFIQVVTDWVNERTSPSTSATAVGKATQGQILQVMGGPVNTSDGITWYQVTGPFTTIGATTPLFPGPWVASNQNGATYLAPMVAPNSTKVVATISGYSVGTPGMLPSGTGLDRGKLFSPDDDGIRDTLPMSWTNVGAMDTVTLTVFAADGSVVTSIPLGAQSSGKQTFVWDGKVDGKAVPDGQYLLQVSAVAGSSTYFAPSASPFGESQFAKLAAIVDTTPTGTYFPIKPERVLDTRYGPGQIGALSAGAPRTIPIAGAAPNIPADAMAVTGNLTVVGASTAGFVRLGSTTDGATSTVNFPAGDTLANGITLALSKDGGLTALYKTGSGRGTVNLVLDLTGYFKRSAAGATFVPVTPVRIVDTRSTKSQLYGKLPAGKVVPFAVAGKGGIPSNAIAITGNATVTGTSTSGYITVDGSLVQGTTPGDSTLNFPAGDTRANNVTLQLNGGGLKVEYVGRASTGVDFIFDVTGYFVADLSGATFIPLAPGRIVDSRTSLGFKGPLRSGATVAVGVSGKASVRPISLAVVGNLTITGQTSYGWAAVGPAAVTSTSTVNFNTIDTRANGFVCILGKNGTLSVTFSGASRSSVQVVLDILGYYR